MNRSVIEWSCHNVSLEFSTEEKSPSLSSFWKEWPPGGKDLGCHKQDCQTESHLFFPQSPKCLCFFFFFIINCVQHANPSLLPQIPHCYPLREGNRAQIREGPVQGTQQVGTCWNPASSLQVQGPGHPACHKLPLLLLPAPPGRERHQP